MTEKLQIQDVLECVILAGAAVLLIWLLTGCAKLHVKSPILSPHEAACRLEGYCGPNSGEVMIGSTVCYTQDVTTPQPLDNRDLRCR